ncbi:hypothetical protein BV25DRAFT_1828145 [Artomyces pyxidatus]|uniref:Uncharacterized protein n=1 Tax=Artomyces pyxidatus TaxID=48021 RepID=A0ACB8SVX5_9AGAM|nr:hypothetical protein BV25DRAFT_1828145 [Artomyces pyxidatus]
MTGFGTRIVKADHNDDFNATAVQRPEAIGSMRSSASAHGSTDDASRAETLQSVLINRFTWYMIEWRVHQLSVGLEDTAYVGAVKKIHLVRLYGDQCKRGETVSGIASLWCDRHCSCRDCCLRTMNVAQAAFTVTCTGGIVRQFCHLRVASVKTTIF